MEMSPKHFYEFGPFQLDPVERVLTRTGTPVPLTPKAFDTLLVLVRRSGHTVEKEELFKEVWRDTFVEDGNLAVNIFALRKALGEGNAGRDYIETIPKRGYKFTAEVREIDPAQPRVSTVAGDNAHAEIRQALRRKSVFWAVLFSTGALAATLGAVFAYRARSKPVLGASDLILVTDFANTTDDPVFDDALKQAVSVQLGQSPVLNILSDAKVGSTLRLMTMPADIKLTPDIARDVCQRAGAKAYIAGSVGSLGHQYVIGLNVINCQTGDAVAQEQVTTDSKEHVLKALGEATTALRKRLGESLNTIKQFDAPIEEVTTPSLNALKALSIGRKTQQVKGNAAAIPYFMQAIELDPNFSAAYAALGISYSNLREPDLASEHLRKAYELRARVSERERFRITAYYYHLVTGEIEKASETYALWAQAYPRDNVPRTNLGVTYGYLGEYEKAVTEIREALRLNPDSAVGYTNLVSHYAALNRLDDAKAVYRQAVERKVDNPYLHLNRYAVAFLENDKAEMQRQLDWASGKVQAEDLLLSGYSDTEAYWGRLKNARELSTRASQSAQGHEQDETAAEWRVNSAIREVEFGNSERARAEASSILATTANREVKILGALVLARAGDARHASRIADDLAKNFSLDTAVNRYWLPCIRAALEIHANNPAKAIDFLQSATPYELGNPLPQAEIGGFLYPVFLRGQVYLQLRRGDAAAAEFQKFLDHRGITLNGALGALAYLGLARAQAMRGDTASSRARYQAFFTLWKDADVDVPVLREAKREYGKLPK